MSPQEMILVALKASIALSLFAIGLKARFADAVSLLRRPSLFLRSTFAMNVAMPVLAAAIAWAFSLPVPVEIALVALAVSPVPPLLPKRQIKAHGEEPYVIGLLVAAAAVAVVFVPLAVELLGLLFQTGAQMQPWPVAKLMLMTVLAPLVAGMLIHRAAPASAAHLARPAALIGALVLIACFLPVLVTAWPSIAALLGSGALLAVGGFVAIGLAIGHALGGPDPHDRTVLALATATRHPGLAMAIGAANFPEEKVLPAILIYVIVGGLIATPYVRWRKRLG